MLLLAGDAYIPRTRRDAERDRASHVLRRRLGKGSSGHLKIPTTTSVLDATQQPVIFRDEDERWRLEASRGSKDNTPALSLAWPA